MKYLHTLICLLLVVTAHAQPKWDLEYHIDFDTNLYLNKLIFDSSATDTHKWQIGMPSKTVFTTAHSGKRAIITDTLLQCAAHDTAIFYMKVPAHAWLGLGELSFWYMLDIDTGDAALIQIKKDTSAKWDTLFIDTVSKNTWIHEVLPVSTPWVFTIDTYIVRFTLFTGNSAKPRDGWMMDDFLLGYPGEGIDDVNTSNTFVIYPNPVVGILCIRPKENIYKETSVLMVNMFGQQVYNKTYPSIADKLQIDVSAFPPGIHSCIITTDSKRYTKHIIIAH